MERMLALATKAGPNTLVLQRFTGREELSRLFEYRLDMVSERSDIKALDMLGTNATVTMELSGGQGQRHFNGYISRFTVLGEVRTPAFKSGVGFQYQATLSPWLWFLTRTSTSQVFCDKSYKDVIDQVLSRWAALKSYRTEIDGQTEKREFCVQYRETDFNFFSRLAEQAGLYYYFMHENGKHQLVLVNSLGQHKAAPGLEKLDFKPETRDAASVTGWHHSAEIQPGAYSLDDFNPIKPKTALVKVAAMERGHLNAGFEYYDYPGEYTEPAWGEKYSKIRMEELYCRHEIGRCATEQRTVQVGFKFKLVHHPVAAQNREYLVIAHDFVAVNNLSASQSGDGASFSSDVTVIPATTQFRAARLTPKPSIAGPQTAFVVGPAGEEIHTDNLGRIRVRFHWDRYAKGNDSDSCWLRVSQPISGKGWGSMHLPRIGHEVVVSFLEGDPDRPIVIGSVPNGDAPPPYALPENKTRTGLKTRTYRGGNDQFNELRFDDKGGAEQVYLQAQHNLDVRVKNDSREHIGNEAHRIVLKDVFEKFGAAHHVDVTGDQNSKIGGSLSFNVAQDTHIKATKILGDAGQEVHLKAGMKLVLEAGVQISIKAGGSFIDIGPAGISIKGAMVMINSGGSAGSGSGASPISAKAAKEAIKSSGGQKDVAPPARPKPKTYGPQASSFLTAAQTGAPFCAVCQGC